MAFSVEFTVDGLVPRPQGSKKWVGGNRFIEASKQLPKWRETVQKEAEKHSPDVPLNCPVRIDLHFVFPMPQSRSKVDKLRGWVWKQTMPDVDKLQRGVFDALTKAGMVHDDARFVRGSFSKREVYGSTGGVTVKITELVYDDIGQGHLLKVKDVNGDQ